MPLWKSVWEKCITIPKPGCQQSVDSSEFPEKCDERNYKVRNLVPCSDN